MTFARRNGYAKAVRLQHLVDNEPSSPIPKPPAERSEAAERGLDTLMDFYALIEPIFGVCHPRRALRPPRAGLGLDSSGRKGHFLAAMTRFGACQLAAFYQHFHADAQKPMEIPL